MHFTIRTKATILSIGVVITGAGGITRAVVGVEL